MKNLVCLMTLMTLISTEKLMAAGPSDFLNTFKKQANPARDAKKGDFTPQDSELIGNFMNMCKADEGQYMHIERTLINPMIKAMINKNSLALNSLIAENAKLNLFQTATIPDTAEKIVVTSWASIQTAKSKAEFINSFGNYLNAFQTIEDVQIVAKKIAATPADRDSNYTMKKMNVEYFYEVRGILANGSRKVDRGYIEMDMSLNKTNWAISDLRIASMDSLQKNRPDFVEITAQSGLTQMPVYERTEAIRRGGYALAVADFNNDGIQDMYVGAKGPGELFVGNAGGGYTKTSMPGLDKMTYVKSAAWADFDNDGYKDLLVVRFTPSKKRNIRKMFNNVVSVYKNNAGQGFKQMEGVQETVPVDYAMPAAIADFNNDGLLDLYIGYPGHRDFTTFHKSDKEKSLLKTQGIYLNAGNMTFKPSPMSGKVNNQYEKFVEIQKLFPHSALAADFNQDGKVDIMVVDDRGNLSPFYMNSGDGKFVKANDKMQVANEGYGMGSATADLNNDGMTDLLATSVHYDAYDRIFKSCSENWGTNLDEGKNSKPLSAYVGTKGVNGKIFNEQAMNLGLNEPGEGLAGIEFLDYNNDGFEDIYVANGLWSGTNRFQDMTSEFARSKFLTDHQTLMESTTSTQSIVMQVLSSFKGDIGSGKAKDRLSLAGFQRNRLYLNNKNGTFTEVGYLEGVDSIADGYTISRVDINNDGKLDLILRNADPGSKEVRFSPVQIYKNNTANGNFLRVKLTGRTTNHDAIGAEVTIETSLGKQTKQVISNNGTVQSEIALHFGLGDLTSVDKLFVKWPTGKTTELKNVKSGNLEITEEVLNQITHND